MKSSLSPLLRLQAALLVAATAMLAALARLTRPAEPAERDDRGDVPGWVMVTVMSAGLVMVIWKVAGPQLSQMVSSALASVHP